MKKEDEIVTTSLTSAELRSIAAESIDETKEYIDLCLEDAMLNYSDVYEAVLLVGSTNLSAVRESLCSLFG